MHSLTYLALAMIVSLTANTLHCFAVGKGQFFYLPRSRGLRYLLYAWTFASFVSALLSLVGTLSDQAFLLIAIGQGIASEFYCILRREMDRKIRATVN